ncbi:MAG: hypothetical protein FJ126_07940 [Deltaproteobacteria bacterium]|nr:hypothetical protein [Deltaproteobacteria bacterium]
MPRFYRDKVDYERHADYIHYNPVKHGHVTRVAAWPYPSFHRYVERGIYALTGRRMVAFAV